jgi:hypothetical protein
MHTVHLIRLKPAEDPIFRDSDILFRKPQRSLGLHPAYDIGKLSIIFQKLNHKRQEAFSGMEK